MNTYTLPTTLEADMQREAARQRVRDWQGEVATPRAFVKQGQYTGAELKRNWRRTIWDTVPSLMSGQRVPRRVPV